MAASTDHRARGSFRQRRISGIVVATLTVVIGLSACGGSGSSPPAVTRPNIVFVLTDDLATNLVQYMPHVLSLERAGTTFTSYTVTDSLCCPSRASIFSGRFPHDTGIFTNGGNDGGFFTFHGRHEERSTFATDLQSVGYRTAMMGKYLNGYLPQAKLGTPSPFVPHGWNEWDVAGNGYPEFDYDLNQNHQVVHYGGQPTDYLTDVLSAKASSFIRSSVKAHAPFMLEVATFAPHIPYVPAPRDANAFPGLKAPRTSAYDVVPSDPPPWLAHRGPLTSKQEASIDADFRKRVQDVQSVDRMIASLESTLKSSGQAKRTIVIFSSDNGYHMGEYRLMPGKLTAFDTDVNVPLVVGGPGVRAGQKVSAPVENIDLRPTFDGWGGAAPPADVDGHSLLSLLTSGNAAGWRDDALVEHHGPDNDPADPDVPSAESGNPPTYNAIRTTTYTYVEYTGGFREFYYRPTDPNELHNLAGRLPGPTLARLHRALTALHTCQGSQACWTAAHLAPAMSSAP